MKVRGGDTRRQQETRDERTETFEGTRTGSRVHTEKEMGVCEGG